MRGDIPHEVLKVTQTLSGGGHEAYLVGGCVRDLLRGNKPKDWDIATNAKPEEVTALFPHAFYENKFGTVGIVNDHVEDETLKVVEVTTYRTEGTYSDNRRPDTVSFSENIEDDLQRRDFTINAIAYNPISKKTVDPYGGAGDIALKKIKAVGVPRERFNEDALRILRAIRLFAELNFSIEEETRRAIEESAYLLKEISQERIRDEFSRILLSEKAMEGLLLARELGVLAFITDELERGVGVEQNQAHKYDVFEHNLRTMKHAGDKGWDLDLRLAGLFHDIAKPQTRRWSEEKKDWTFYGHDVVGGRVSKKILEQLKFPKHTIDKVSKMVRWHMFFSDTEKITLSAVRRLIRNVGKEDVWDLMNLRICDRIGTGRPKENPYRFRKYKAMVEEALHDPVSVGMLKTDGIKIMKVAELPAGPKIGNILHALLEEVLEDPAKNNENYLDKRTIELNALSDEELRALGEKGKETKEEREQENIKTIRDRYWVE